MPARTTQATRPRRQMRATGGATGNAHASSLPDMAAETADNRLRRQVTKVFSEAQRTTASHRKLVVTLRKTHEACRYGTERERQQRGQADNVFDEADFNGEFTRCVVRAMAVRKSEAVGDRTIRFVGLYLRHATDKDEARHTGTGTGDQDDEDEDDSTMPETAGSQLTGLVVDTVFPLLTAKEKGVRYRATQLLSHLVNSLDAVEDDVFRKLRAGLLRRIRDKESMVRAQAVLGLSRLLAGSSAESAESETDDGDDEGDPAATTDRGLLEKLLELLQNDASAEVRRSLLVNLPILPATLPYLLERARDQDAATRRAVYSRLLPALGDFRHLSLSMREKLLRWGLRDRDDKVRNAAARLFRERWIEDCAGGGACEDDDEAGRATDTSPPSLDALLELVERIDVVNSGAEDGIALEAMKTFWDGRSDYRDAVRFDDGFFATLSAESVFLLRSFSELCRTDGRHERLVEEKLPEVSRLAFYLERYINVLTDAIRKAERDPGRETDTDEGDEDTAEQEFIVEQLLHVALTLDYSDEVGRRNMFSLLRQTLCVPELPDETTRLTVAVLRDLCATDAAGEKEFCSIVLEAVADVHDTVADAEAEADAEADADDASFHSARSDISRESTPTQIARPKQLLSEQEAADKAVKEILINMKCLHMVQCMLANVRGALQENDHLVAMLNNLVVPAVRSHEAPVRERGLVCLGLCSLLDRSLASENVQLFTHFFAKGHPALQRTALHILTDMLTVHDSRQLLDSHPALVKTYIKALRPPTRSATPPSSQVRSVAVLATCKLLLTHAIADPHARADLLRTLVVTYFEPSGASEPGVRQPLNYFLPVFCYSRADNQSLLRVVALDALHALYKVREARADDAVDEDMVSLAAVGACLVDWTDPRKCYVPGQRVEAERRPAVAADVHLDLARDILLRLAGNASREEKKTMAVLLAKLYVSPVSSESKTREVYALACEAIEAQTLADAVSRNALHKIHVALGRIVNGLEAMSGLRSVSRSLSVGIEPSGEDKTVVLEANIKEEEEEEDDGMEEARRRDALLVSEGVDEMDKMEGVEETDKMEGVEETRGMMVP